MQHGCSSEIHVQFVVTACLSCCSATAVAAAVKVVTEQTVWYNPHPTKIHDGINQMLFLSCQICFEYLLG